jgi:hypothetical protein
MGKPPFLLPASQNPWSDSFMAQSQLKRAKMNELSFIFTKTIIPPPQSQPNYGNCTALVKLPSRGQNPALERRRKPGRVTVRQAHGLSKIKGRESIGAKG